MTGPARPAAVRLLPTSTDPLEAKQMLTTLTVATLGDTPLDRLGVTDGLISFAEAVEAVNTGGVFGDANGLGVTNIEFLPGLIGLGSTLTLNEGALTISEGVTINGNGLDVTIDAGGADRALVIDATAEVTINAMTFRNGASTDGGAMLLNPLANLRLTDCVVEENVATGAGGAIAALADSTLTVIGSTFRGNTAVAAGGALRLFNGTHTFVDSVFGGAVAGQENTAGTVGGAISKAGSGALTVNGTDILGNSADQSGGGIFIDVAAAGTAPVLKMRNGTLLADNSVNATVNGRGGGIAAIGVDLDLSGVFVRDNGVGGSASMGGGVYAEDGTGSLVNVRIGGNALSGSNGEGGGLAVSGGDLTLSNTLIGSFDIGGESALGNTVGSLGCGAGMLIRQADVLIGGGAIRENTGAARGGGLCIVAPNGTISNGTVIDGNSAADGGGVYADVTGILSVNGVTLSANTASDDGGGLFQDNGRLVSIGSTFADNVATDDGGGIWTDASQNMLLTNADLDGNTADRGAGLFRAAAGGRLTLGGGTVRNNVAADHGGGLALNGAGLSVVRNNAAFTDNASNGFSLSGGGGAIYGNDGQLSIQQVSFSGNTATGRGGAVHQEGARLGVVNSTFTGNTANSGGAISADAVPAVLTNVTVGGATENLGNHAASGFGGGGVYMTGGAGRLTVSGATFQSNTASAGGGLSVHDATLVMRNNSLVADNVVADGNGGGLYLANSTASLQQSTVRDNQAGSFTGFNPGTGGGVYVVGGEATLVGTTVAGNVASTAGGGVGVFTGSVRLFNSTVGGATAADGNRVEAESGAARWGGGISVNNNAQAELVNTLVRNNTAMHRGGGLYVAFQSELTTRANTRILDNTAGGSGNTTSTFGGGGVWLEDSLLSMTRTTVSGNRAAENAAGSTWAVEGGGLHLEPAAGSVISYSTIAENVSDEEGGGLFLKDGTLTLDRVMIELNEALDVDATGGGLFLDEPTASTSETNVTVRNNVGGNRNR